MKKPNIKDYIAAGLLFTGLVAGEVVKHHPDVNLYSDPKTQVEGFSGHKDAEDKSTDGQIESDGKSVDDLLDERISKEEGVGKGLAYFAKIVQAPSEFSEDATEGVPYLNNVMSGIDAFMTLGASLPYMVHQSVEDQVYGNVSKEEK